MTRLARQTADRFVLAPSWSAYLLGFIVATFSGVIVIACGAAVVQWMLNGFTTPTKNSPGGMLILFVVIAGFFHWVGLRILTRRTRFDKRTGRMTGRVLWRTDLDMLLADILAVQCIYAGMRSSNARGPQTWHIYQINLVLNDNPDQRVNLRTESDGPWVRATATALAEFLEAPLVDQFALTKAPCDQPQKPSALRRLWNWCRRRKELNGCP